MDTIAARFREGRKRGLPDAAVGNLLAHRMGLTPVAAGWTPRELAHIAFLAVQYDGDLDAGREGVVSVRDPNWLPRRETMSGLCDARPCVGQPKHRGHLPPDYSGKAS